MASVAGWATPNRSSRGRHRHCPYSFVFMQAKQGQHQYAKQPEGESEQRVSDTDTGSQSTSPTTSPTRGVTYTRECLHSSRRSLKPIRETLGSPVPPAE